MDIFRFNCHAFEFLFFVFLFNKYFWYSHSYVLSLRLRRSMVLVTRIHTHGKSQINRHTTITSPKGRRTIDTTMHNTRISRTCVYVFNAMMMPFACAKWYIVVGIHTGAAVLSLLLVHSAYAFILLLLFVHFFPFSLLHTYVSHSYRDRAMNMYTVRLHYICQLPAIQLCLMLHIDCLLCAMCR